MRLGTSKLHLKSGTKEYRQRYYQTYKERQLQLGKVWYKANKARKLAVCKEWQKVNSERIRKNQIKRLYNLDSDTYDKMLLNQTNRCKICQNILGKPIVEHDHTTKRVRGLVCQRCNVLIGAYESAHKSSLISVIEAYLELTKEAHE